MVESRNGKEAGKGRGEENDRITTLITFSRFQLGSRYMGSYE